MKKEIEVDLKTIIQSVNKVFKKYKYDEDINNKVNENLLNSKDLKKIKKVVDNVIGGNLIIKETFNNNPTFKFLPDYRYYEGEFEN